MEKITACTLDCPDACSLIATLTPRGELSLRGNPRHPVTRGFTCRKIRSLPRRLKSPDRILQPHLKHKSGWRRIGWEEALDRCADQIHLHRAEPGAILHIQGDGAKGVVKEAVKTFFAVLGASGTRGALCDGAGYEACLRDFGSRENHDLDDLRHSQKIVNWGKDLPRTSVHLAAAVQRARRKGARLLTISPGGDSSMDWSDGHVRIPPGTDRFLAAAAIRQLMEGDRVAEKVLTHCANWDRFREMIQRHSFEELMRGCAASAAEVDMLSRWYAEGGATATLIGTGLQRYHQGGENVRFINALAMVSGNIGRSGGGVNYHLNSLKNFNPSWITQARSAPRRSFPLPTIGRDIMDARHPKIEMAWINGCNIVNQAPDALRVAGAIEAIPFTVVVDAFMTDTALRADLVLPAALMLEQEDLIGSFMHDYVHIVPAVADPPGEARDDLSIVRDIARRLDPPVEVPGAEVCMQMALDAPCIEVSLDELRERGFVRARHPEVAYGGLRFDHPDGNYRFATSLHPSEPVRSGYPLRLMTLVRRGAMHSQILPDKQVIPPRVWIAPEAPVWNDLDKGKAVFLESRLGRMEVRLEEMPGLYPGAVVYRRGDWLALGGGANRLIGDQVTDMGEGAAYYEQWVRLVNG